MSSMQCVRVCYTQYVCGDQLDGVTYFLRSFSLLRVSREEKKKMYGERGSRGEEWRLTKRATICLILE